MAVAGSIVVTTSDLGGGYTRYSVAWLSSAGGAVTENSFDVKRGNLRQVKFFPNAGGTQPTDLYDLTLPDADGFDVLAGVGANLSNATAKVSVPLFGDGTTSFQPFFHAGGPLTPTIAAAGNAKRGTIVLIVGP